MHAPDRHPCSLREVCEGNRSDWSVLAFRPRRTELGEGSQSLAFARKVYGTPAAAASSVFLDGNELELDAAAIRHLQHAPDGRRVDRSLDHHVGTHRADLDV